VYFIIGHRNPNWRENEDFANRIHERLEKQYPGLSRGVWGKTAANGNGEYNQSVAPGSVLIEIGGVDNTLEECYRTADALAKVISDIYWNDEKAIEAAAPQK
jgi:stage II sporulation protein P